MSLVLDNLSLTLGFVQAHFRSFDRGWPGHGLAPLPLVSVPEWSSERLPSIALHRVVHHLAEVHQRARGAEDVVGHFVVL